MVAAPDGGATQAWSSIKEVIVKRGPIIPSRLRLLWSALLAALLVAGFAGCAGGTPRPASAATTAQVAAAPPAASAPLKAVLFGYIPDSAKDNFQALRNALTERFQAVHPQVSLSVTIDPSLNLYDFKPGGELSTLLGSGAGAVDVVEVDTLLLGTLVDSGWVQALAADNRELVPTAQSAAVVNGKVYGVPTYVCSNVIYAHDGGLTAVQDGPALLKFLSALSAQTPLVGSYHGSFTLPSVYLDAWADTNGTAGLAGAYLPPVDSKTMGSFAALVASCAAGGRNPCLDKTYANGTGAETAFAQGQANGFVGYTERLFYILDAAPSQPLPSVISAPLGLGTHPVMFVDALVVNPHCTGSCLANAMQFIAFMSQLGTRNLIAFSQDSPQPTFPRYLLQARTDFYQDALARNNPFYPSFWQIVRSAVAFPNQGFTADYLKLGPAVLQALGGSSVAPAR
jgi:thiamine pyridinylase